jgi:hypothetical protein
VRKAEARVPEPVVILFSLTILSGGRGGIEVGVGLK